MDVGERLARQARRLQAGRNDGQRFSRHSRSLPNGERVTIRLGLPLPFRRKSSCKPGTKSYSSHKAGGLRHARSKNEGKRGSLAMNIMEFNKIAGAVLSALLLVFGTRALVDIVTPHGSGTPGFVLPVKAPAASGPVAAGPAFNVAKIAELLPKASPDAGQAVFKKCATCHTVEKGGKHGTQGPNLWGVVGRHIGSAAGFNYSEAMKARQSDWTYDNLANYLHDPKGWLPGNKMAFAGLSDDAELADVLAY